MAEDLPLQGPKKPERPNYAFTDNYLEEMQSIPLFMTSLPDDADENPMLQALQSLAYDGTPEGKQELRRLDKEFLFFFAMKGVHWIN